MQELQRSFLHTKFDAFMAGVRELAISDQELAEWLLQLSARWLLAHGVSASNIQEWVRRSLERRAPVPLTAAARARNDFGGVR